MKSCCKKITRVFLWCALLAVAFSSLSGCASIKREEAKEITTKFFDALQEGNYEKAESYFHPEVLSEGHIQKGELERYMQSAKQYGIDFTSGYEILQYTSFTSHASIGEATHEHTATVKTGDTTFTVELTFYRNADAVGITAFSLNFSIDPGEQDQTPPQTISLPLNKNR